ncbi:hypothetical protein XAPC_2225 [Xanthomonas citri pv. punicae str. LMG 859]|nr:hypothetical protein XAPC_2225 [Xanthomonas citri pv. punicae str. LMG 859]
MVGLLLLRGLVVFIHRARRLRLAPAPLRVYKALKRAAAVFCVAAAAASAACTGKARPPRLAAINRVNVLARNALVVLMAVPPAPPWPA